MKHSAARRSRALMLTALAGAVACLGVFAIVRSGRGCCPTEGRLFFVRDGLVRARDPESPPPGGLFILELQSGRVQCLDPNVTKDAVLAAPMSGRPLVYQKTARGELLYLFPDTGANGTVPLVAGARLVCVSADGTKLCYGASGTAHEDQLWVQEMATPVSLASTAPIALPSSCVDAMGFLPDGKTVLCRGVSGEPLACDLSSRTARPMAFPPGISVWDGRCSPDGSEVALSGVLLGSRAGGPTLAVWRIASGDLPESRIMQAEARGPRSRALLERWSSRWR